MSKTTPRKTSPIDHAIGRRIRLLRKKAALPLSELAAALGISVQQLQKYEAGHNRLSAGRLYDVAKCLGLPVSRLYPETGLDSASPDPASARLTPEAGAFLESYHRIAQTRRRKVIGALVLSLARENGDDSH